MRWIFPRALARFQAARARATCLNESGTDYDSTSGFGGFGAEQIVDEGDLVIPVGK